MCIFTISVVITNKPRDSSGLQPVPYFYLIKPASPHARDENGREDCLRQVPSCKARVVVHTERITRERHFTTCKLIVHLWYESVTLDSLHCPSVPFVLLKYFHTELFFFYCSCNHRVTCLFLFLQRHLTCPSYSVSMPYRPRAEVATITRKCFFDINYFIIYDWTLFEYWTIIAHP